MEKSLFKMVQCANCLQRLVLARAIFQHGTSISCLVPVNSLFMEDA